MPIAKIQLPDGRIAKFEVPEGTTEQDVMSYVESNSNLFNQTFKQEAPTDDLSFQEKNRQRLANFAKGIPQGLGNAFVGAVQTATDIGETGARLAEKAIYKDEPLEKETFGTRLATEVKGLKERQSKLPLSERLGTGLGEVAPYAGVGAGMSLVKQGALAGGISGFLSPQEEAGLGKRVKEGVIDAGIGAVATPIVAKTIEKAVNIPNVIKGIFSKKTPEDKVSNIVSKNIPKEEIEKGIKELEQGSENIVGLDINSAAFENMFKTSLDRFPDSKQIASEFGRGRMTEGYNRINKSLNRISLKDSGTRNIAKLDKEMKAITTPLYEIANEADVVIPQFTYKTIKTTELPSTTRFTNQSKTSGVRKDMQTDLESTEQFMKGGKATSIYDDEKGVITEGNKFLQSQKETGSFTSGTTKGDTITKTQSKIIQEGNKNIKIDRKITNFKDLSAKDKKIAMQFENIKENELFSVAENGMKSLGFSAEINTVNDLAKLKIGLDEKITTMQNADLKRRATQFRKEIDGLIGELNPERKVADEIFSGYKKIINAGEEGLKFNSIKKSELDNIIKDYNPKQLEAYRASAKEALLETVEKNVIDLGEKTAKVKGAEAIFDNLYKRENIKLLFKEDKAGYDAFKREMIDEIKFNQTLQRFGLNIADVVNDSNLAANIAGRALAFGAGGGKTGILFETGRFIEKLALKRYKGLDKKTANDLAKAMTNKENSLKTLKSAYNKIQDKEQKIIANQFIKDMSPAIGLSITNEFTD
jgi:hypothetical protein